MIVESATEALVGMGHRAVTVTIQVTKSGYFVSVEETCTKLKGISIEHIEPPKATSVTYATLEELYEKAYEISDGWGSLGEEEGISDELLGKAIRSAIERIEDVLLANMAAHVEDHGTFVVDCDEETCRKLIRRCAKD